MCREHWAMVPRTLQSALWATYVPGQENRMDPSVAYLRAAAHCVRAVAEAEGQSPDQIEREIEAYLLWAEMLDASEDEGPSNGG